MKKLVLIAEWIVAVFGTAVGAVLLAEKVFYSFDDISEKYCFNLQHVVLGCLIYLALFVLVNILCSRIPSVRGHLAAHIAVTLIFEVAFCLSLILGSRIYFGSDPGAVYNLAVRFMHGDYSAVIPKDSYLAIWPQQYGIIFIYEVIMRILGKTNGMIIQFMNGMLVVLATLAGFGILWKISPKRSSVTAYSLLWIGFFPFFFHVTSSYGDVPATCLSLMAVYCMIQAFEPVGHRKLWMTAASAAIIFACIFKKNALICLVAIMLVSIVMVLKEFEIRKVLWLLLTFILAVEAVPFIQKTYEIRAGQESGGGIPMLSFVAMSMQEGLGGPGSWNGYHSDLFLRMDYDPDATAAQSREDIRKSLKGFMDDPKYMLDFYTAKVAYQWTEGSFNGVREMENAFGADGRSPWVTCIIDGPARAVFIRIANWHQSVVYVAFMVSMILLLKDQRQKKFFCLGKMYLTVMVIGGFLFCLIWESASRYVMMYYAMMLPMAAEAVARVYEAFTDFRGIREAFHNK